MNKYIAAMLLLFVPSLLIAQTPQRFTRPVIFDNTAVFSNTVTFSDTVDMMNWLRVRGIVYAPTVSVSRVVATNVYSVEVRATTNVTTYLVSEIPQSYSTPINLRSPIEMGQAGQPYTLGPLIMNGLIMGPEVSRTETILYDLYGWGHPFQITRQVGEWIPARSGVIFNFTNRVFAVQTNLFGGWPPDRTAYLGEDLRTFGPGSVTFQGTDLAVSSNNPPTNGQIQSIISIGTNEIFAYYTTTNWNPCMITIRDNHSTLVFQGLHFKAPYYVGYSNAVSATSAMLTFLNCRDVQFRHCVFEGTADATNLWGSFNGSSYESMGAAVDLRNSSAYFYQCTFKGTGATAIKCAARSHVYITDCETSGSITSPVAVYAISGSYVGLSTSTVYRFDGTYSKTVADATSLIQH